MDPKRGVIAGSAYSGHLAVGSTRALFRALISHRLSYKKLLGGGVKSRPLAKNVTF